ncbi:MAG TPA: hypothetical protein VHG72_01750 [Polyangia bacterium]|nr:hypothetical protein [Polyangia bacterium]
MQLTAKQLRTLTASCEAVHAAILGMSATGGDLQTRRETNKILRAAGEGFILAKPPRWHLLSKAIAASIAFGKTALPALKTVADVCGKAYGINR